MTGTIDEFDDLDLDRRWNRVVREGRDAPFRLTDMDIHDILLADDATPPPSHFVQALREQLRMAAATMSRESEAARRAPVPMRTAGGGVADTGPMPAQRGVTRWASLALVAALLLSVAGGALYRERTGNSDPTTIPAAAFATPGASPAGEGASSLDPGNTGVRAGSGPVVPLSIAGVLPVGINGMAVTDDALVIEYGSALTAYDPRTLGEIWSVELDYGVYSAPVIAGDTIYLSFTAQRNGATEALLGIDDSIDNRLLAFSLADGSPRWSVDEAGAATTAPIVVDGTIYALGEHDGRYVVRALDTRDGAEFWVSEPLPNQIVSTNSRPRVMAAFNATLAHGEGAIAVTLVNGITVLATGTGEQRWSYTHEEEPLATVQSPVIAGDTMLVSIERQWVPREDGSPFEGLAEVRAFNLNSGDVRWTHAFGAGAAQSGLAASEDRVALLTWRTDINEGRQAPVTLHLLNLEDGVELATTELVEGYLVGAFGGSRTSMVKTGPIIAGGMVYTAAGEATPEQAGVISAFDLTTGELRSTTLVDGFIVERPAMVDGRLLVASEVEGILVLDGEPESAGQAAPVTDLREVNACTAPASELPVDLDDLPEARADTAQSLSPAEVPTFDPADAAPAEVAEAITTRFAEYQGCARGDQQNRLYGFFSDGYYEMLVETGQTDILTGKNGEPRAPFFANSGEIQTLQTDTLQLFADGRVGGIVTGAHAPRYVYWIEQDGLWVIDEWHTIIE